MLFNPGLQIFNRLFPLRVNAVGHGEIHIQALHVRSRHHTISIAAACDCDVVSVSGFDQFQVPILIHGSSAPFRLLEKRSCAVQVASDCCYAF